MPKIKIIQNNLSAGELSPTALGRTDIARYPNAVKTLTNVIPMTLGGGKKRPGTEYVAEVKDSDVRTVLVPYIVGVGVAYMLEFGDQYMRVFTPDGEPVMDGLSPYEIATPFTTAQIEDIDFCQAEDAMYVFHKEVYPQRVRVFADDSWDCSNAPFTTVPFAEVGVNPAANLTLSANTVGTGRTVTADASVFFASDVGRAILWEAGIAVITAYTSGTEVTAEVKVIFPYASIPTGEWNLDSSPQTTLTPSIKDPVGASITLTLTAAGWRSSDVGKFVSMNEGLVKIVSITSSTIAVGTIIQELNSTVAAPSLSWALESSIWGGDYGYPCTGTLHEQRLVTAGTTRNPQSVFGSQTGEPLDFTIGVDDDDGYNFTIDSTQTNEIAYVAGARNLVVLTYGGEFAMFSGNEKPITPTNVQVKPQSPHGARRVKPCAVGKEILFAQRAGRKLRTIGYRYDEDGYKSTDLTTLAEHITASGIRAMAFQQEPDPVVWVVLNNGRLVSVTFDRDLDVIAWAGHETDGAVESIASIPADDGDQVWMIVRRQIGEEVKRYVERFQPNWFPIYGQETPSLDAIPPDDGPVNWGFTLDCAVAADSEEGTDTFTGLDHLEGKTVRVIADGVDMPPVVVESGSITLPRNANRVLIGLMYQPTIRLLPPELQGQGGSVQGDAMSVSETTLRMNNTISTTINGDEAIPGRIIGPDQLNMPPVLYTGDISRSGIGWSKGQPETVISQAHPFPFHVLAIIRTITINGG